MFLKVHSGASRERKSAFSGGGLSGALCHQVRALYKSMKHGTLAAGFGPILREQGER